MLSFKREQPKQADALVAKNYCTEEELSALNSVVSAYLEFAVFISRNLTIVEYKFQFFEKTT